MPIEHKHIARHTENTQQMLAKSIFRALREKWKYQYYDLNTTFFFGLAKKKTESESDQAFSSNYQFTGNTGDRGL